MIKWIRESTSARCSVLTPDEQLHINAEYAFDVDTMLGMRRSNMVTTHSRAGLSLDLELH